jgi:DNA-binding ferritin-like protein
MDFKLANLYLATLKAIAAIHQHNHWTAHGSTFYSDHLLYERIYASTQEDIDTVAEKLIGVYGEECVDFSLQAKLSSDVQLKFRDKQPLERSLAVEEEFCLLSKKIYDDLRKAEKLTLGVDDMIMSICSKHETSIYLLKRSAK